MNIRIRHAVAATLLLGAAGSASAFDITTYAGTPLYVGGSTAIDKALLAYFEETADTASPCVTNSATDPIDVYTGTLTNVKFIAVACTANTANTGAVADPAKHIVFIKEDNGGSINGIQGVGLTSAGGQTLSFPALVGLTTAGGTPNCDTSAKAAVPGVTSAFNAHACAAGYSALATPIQGNMGFADVEASIFGLDTSSTGLDLTPQSTIDIVFAPAVSLGLYHALQKSQGLPQDDLTADIPSLTKEALSAVYTGKVLAWTSVAGTGGTVFSQTNIQFGTSGGAAHEFNGGAPGTAASSKIFLCRRDNGSGTEKTSEIVFGNLVCSAGNVAFRSAGAQDALGASWTQPATIAAAANTFSGNGTGAVLNCLQGLDELGGYAIGFASVDNGWGSKGSTNAAGVGNQDFRYVKVDGVVPSIEDVASGLYHYWAQSSGYQPGPGAGHTNRATGDAAVVLNYVTGVTVPNAGIGDASAIGALNTNAAWTNGPTWDGGIVGIPGNVGNAVNPPTASLATFRGNPVNDFVKANGGNNNCQPAVAASGAVLGANGQVTWSSP